MRGLAHLRPAERFEQATVEAYIRSMQCRLRSATVTIRIDGLVRALSAMAPEEDIAWLRRILQHLKRQTRDRKPKLDRIRPSQELYRLGLNLMHEAETDPSLQSRKAAVQFRDGLVIAFLAARAIRLSTFAGLELEHHLARRGQAYWLDVPGDLTKTGARIAVPLPTDLTPYITRYIANFRPKLLGGDTTTRVWVSQRGEPISRSGIGNQIRWRTRQEFTPQLFRDCAATSMAVQDPDHIHVAAVLLGHKTLRTTERYYNQSRLLDASRHYHAQIRRLRAPLRRAGTRP